MTDSPCESQNNISPPFDLEIMRELDALDLSAEIPAERWTLEPMQAERPSRLEKIAHLCHATHQKCLERKPNEQPRQPLGKQAEIARYRREEGREDWLEYRRKWHRARALICENREVKPRTSLANLSPEEKKALKNAQAAERMRLKRERDKAPR